MTKGTPWTTCELASVCQKTSTWNPAKDKRAEFTYVDVSAVSNERFIIVNPSIIAAADAPSRARKILQAGDTIFATVRPSLRRVAFVKSEYDNQIASTAFCVLRPSPKELCPRFLFFGLLTDDICRRIAELERGVAYPAVTDSDILRQRIPLPPLPEQKKIAAVLSKHWKAVEAQVSIIGNLRELKKSMMNRLFTHGLRGEPLKKTEIGMMPRSWGVKSIAQLIADNTLVEIQDGNHGEKHPVKSDFVADGIPFITANCFEDGNIVINTMQTLTPGFVRTLRIGFAKPGDVLLTHKGTIGETSIVSQEHELLVLSPQVTYYRINGSNKSLIAGYLQSVFQTPSFAAALKSLSAGQSTRAYISITNQKTIRIPMPTKEEQAEIAAVGRLLGEKLLVHEAKKSALEDLFKAMLNKLMTGAIRVKDWDVDTREVEGC